MIATVAASALLLAVVIVPVFRENRARRKQDDAAEETQATKYWAAMDAFLGWRLSDDPEAYAAAQYAAMAEADAAAGLLDTAIPPARKES